MGIYAHVIACKQKSFSLSGGLRAAFINIGLLQKSLRDKIVFVANTRTRDGVESYFADQEQMLAEIRQADQQVKAGHYIRHEDMKAWLLSWGTVHELPPPKCVCGKEHDNEADLK